MSLRTLNEKKGIFYLIVIAVILLLIPHIIRFSGYNNSLMGFEPYYHQRLTEKIIEQGKINYDPLSYTGSNYISEPYHHILAISSSIINLEVVLSTAAISTRTPSDFRWRKSSM